MKIITTLNEKGGVGKTTISTTLASGLAITGYTVLLIDADPQGHAGLSLGIDKAPGFYDLIVRKKDWTEVVLEVPAERYQVPDQASDVKGHLFLVPSNVETRSIVTSTNGNRYAIVTRLIELNDLIDIDYIIFDTSPTPSDLHEMIYVATDEVIYPSQLAFLSLDGLKESLKRLDVANRMRQGENLPHVILGGVIPNMTRMGTIEHGESLKQITKAFGKDRVYEPIALRTAWEQATRAQKSIFAYEPFDKAAHSASRMIKRFLALQGVHDVEFG